MAIASDALEVLKELIGTELFLGDHPQRQAAYAKARALVLKLKTAPTVEEQTAVQLARDEYESDTIEIDECPELSCDVITGTVLWVAAWVWVGDLGDDHAAI